MQLETKTKLKYIITSVGVFSDIQLSSSLLCSICIVKKLAVRVVLVTSFGTCISHNTVGKCHWDFQKHIATHCKSRHGVVLACIGIYMHVCVYVCMCIYIYIYVYVAFPLVLWHVPEQFGRVKMTTK